MSADFTIPTQPETIDVVVRCRNEMPYTRHTLEALARQQGVQARVFFIDCRSTDGSREAAVEHGVRIHDLDPKAYIPGVVLNFGMAQTQSSIVAFINADAIPRDEHALRRLIDALRASPSGAAVYGRQVARPDADTLTRLDYERAFGSEALVTRFGAFYSMAASAIRRDAWEKLPFDESLRYSEDVDWVYRAQALGWTIEYAPDAVYEHSHAYDLRAHFKRRLGEGVADTMIYRLQKPSVLKDLVRSLGGTLLRDARAGALSIHGVATRAVQVAGYFEGRRRGEFRA